MYPVSKSYFTFILKHVFRANKFSFHLEAATQQEEEAPSQPADAGTETADTPTTTTTSGEGLADSQTTTHRERKRKNKDKPPMPAPPAGAVSTADGEAPGSSTGPPEIEDIELIIRPHPSHTSTMEHCETRYLKTTVNANVNHLRTFLTMRLALEKGVSASQVEAEKLFSLFVVDNEMEEGEEEVESGEVSGEVKYVLIDANVPLGDVQVQYWKEGRPLELFYVEANKGDAVQDEAPTGEGEEQTVKEEEEVGKSEE